MFRISHANHAYAWGSRSAIHQIFADPTPGLIAEAWMGAHPSAPSREVAPTAQPLTEIIARDVDAMLGPDVVARFGACLPYLLKVIAAERPLSLQVHPNLARARAGYEAEDRAGVPVDAPHRNYRDRNHKPELVYALTQFEALSGFRAPRRAAEMFVGLEAPVAKELHEILVAEPSVHGMRAAFTQLMRPETRPSVAEVEDLARACAERLAAGSPSPRADRTVALLHAAYPGDPGVVTSLLLNPVTLQPGEAMFVPAGGVHAYLSGVAVEIMASSDNVLRAGLTPKHVDVAEVLDNVDYVAAPPIRIAPEVFHGATKLFYAPVDDFELSVTELRDDEPHPLPGRGPRVLLCLEGAVRVTSAAGTTLDLEHGHVAFAPSADGPLMVQGRGLVIQADVP